jgi:hypothetical protein
MQLQRYFVLEIFGHNARMAQALSQPRPFALESRALVPPPAAITAIAIALAAWYLEAAINWRQAALFLVGAGAGIVL